MTTRFVAITVLLLFLSSCSAYKLDSAQHSLRTSFAQQNYSGSAELLSKFQKNKVYKSKDEVLFSLEQGAVNHFGGNYVESNIHFTQAEDQIDLLYTKSISRAIQSFLINDNSLAYDGEDYEDVYLNIFKTLNYIHLEELESALVESRRIAYKLDQLNLKYHGLVEALSKADTSGHATWKSGETNIQNSALGHYLSAILFAKTNKPDDARIEYENLLKSFNEQPSVYAFAAPDRDQLKQIIDPYSYNVLVTGFSGRAPQKIQHDGRLYLDGPDLYLKFSLPSLIMYDSQVARVEVETSDGVTRPLSLIEEMDVVAREVYKVKEPIIYARTIVRAFIKAVGTNKLSREIGKEDAIMGDITNILGKVGQEATEKADLRSWQTMPGKAYATVLNLPEGEHEVVIHYYGYDNQLLSSHSETINVTGQRSLNLVESLYWN